MMNMRGQIKIEINHILRNAKFVFHFVFHDGMNKFKIQR